MLGSTSGAYSFFLQSCPNMEMPSMERKRKLSKPKVWPVVNCLYDQLLQAKEALEKAKVALRKAKKKLYGAMAEYQDAMGSNCSHGSEFFTLWENQMCCPKLCFTCCGSESGDCNGEACTTSDDSAR